MNLASMILFEPITGAGVLRGAFLADLLADFAPSSLGLPVRCSAKIS